MKEKAFASEQFFTKTLGSVPAKGWAFCGGVLNANWKMLLAVWPDYQTLIVAAKKNKGNYYKHYNFILTQSPSVLKRKPHGLNEIEYEHASADVGDPRPPRGPTKSRQYWDPLNSLSFWWQKKAYLTTLQNKQNI